MLTLNFFLKISCKFNKNAFIFGALKKSFNQNEFQFAKQNLVVAYSVGGPGDVTRYCVLQ